VPAPSGEIISERWDDVVSGRRATANRSSGADHSVARDARPQVRADRSLVNKHQPGGIKHALLSHPTSACARHICSLPLGRLRGFF